MILDPAGRPKYRIAICVPSQDSVSAGFAFDLTRMAGYIPLDIRWTLFNVRGTYLPQQRASLVEEAQKWTATHVLWLDSDMRFPPDTLTRLLAHKVPIVAANYATRRQPILPVSEHREHGKLFTNPESNGLADVSYAGMGVMLVDMTVYTTLTKPYFALGYNPRDEGWAGEDVYFCRKAADAGFPTLIDQTLSQQVKHVGEWEYTHHHTAQTRDALLQAQEA